MRLDYNALLKLLPSHSPLMPQVKRSLSAVSPRVEAAKSKETAEMLDKLKGLGNSILGIPNLCISFSRELIGGRCAQATLVFPQTTFSSYPMAKEGIR